MTTGSLKNKVNAIWQDFYNENMAQTRNIVNQLTTLMFIKMFDDKQSAIEAQTSIIGIEPKQEDLIFKKGNYRKFEVINGEEYNELFSEDFNLVIFVRRNIELNPLSVEAFIEKERNKGFNDEQIACVKELLLFISQNGKFERTDLLREELNFNGIFNSQEIGSLIKVLEERF